MEITLYRYDPKTNEPTGEKEVVTLPEGSNVYSMGIGKIWEVANLEGEPTATIWEPPVGRCVFDGHGWVSLEGLDAPSAVHLLAQGVVNVGLVLQLGLGDAVLEELKLLVNGALSTYGNSLDSTYSTFEKGSWDYQLEEAKAILDDSKADAPILTAVAQAEGKDVKAIAESVLSKDKERKQALKDFAVLANTARAKLVTAERTYVKSKKAALESLVELLRKDPFKIA